MKVSGSVVAFGDELGLPLVLEALGGMPLACMVVDPRREAVRRWLDGDGSSFRVLFHPDVPSRDEFVHQIVSLRPRLGVIYSYSRILWPELIALFPLGVVNVHGGRLPRYRGANVLQWAIINGEVETAVTLHYVDEGIDTGPIIAEEPLSISEDDTALTLRERMKSVARLLLSHWLPRLVADRVPSVPQSGEEARSWPRRKPEDGLIDWSWSDRQIRDLTRALVPPWPGAQYLDRSGTKVVIDRPLTLEDVAALRREMAR